MEGLYKNKYHIQSTRLRGYDYGSSGYYFVTICTHKRVYYFGQVVRDSAEDVFVGLSDVGCVVRDCWAEIPNHFRNVSLDEWIIMPNHVHGIIEIKEKLSPSRSNAIYRVGTTPNVRNHSDDQDAMNRVCTRSHNRVGGVTGNHNIMLDQKLGTIIRAFKGRVSYTCRKRDFDFQWQPRYYDIIIRDERALCNIRHYIKQNPYKWKRDRNNAENIWY